MRQFIEAAVVYFVLYRYSKLEKRIQNREETNSDFTRNISFEEDGHNTCTYHVLTGTLDNNNSPEH